MRPFSYERLLSTFRCKMIIMCIGICCLLMGSIPIIFYPVALKAGWYCAIVQYELDSNRTIHAYQPLAYQSMTLIYISNGCIVMVVFTVLTLKELRRMKKSVISTGHKMETRIARFMALIGLIFLITYLPTVVSIHLGHRGFMRNNLTFETQGQLCFSTCQLKFPYY